MNQELIWKKEYEIGNFEIDTEHKIFLKIIQKIDHAFTEKQPKDYILSLLRELYKYADFHFISEENLMKLAHYPDFKTHKEEHDKLLTGLSEKIGFFDVQYIDAKKLIEFLVDWFLNHTAKVDTKLGAFLKTLDSN